MLSISLTEQVQKLIKELDKELNQSNNKFLKDMLEEYENFLNTESRTIKQFKYNSTYYLDNCEIKNHLILKYLYKIEKINNILLQGC